MFQNVTNPETALLTPLSEYVAEATKKDEHEQLQMFDEIAACRALLHVYHPAIDDTIKKFNKLATENPKDPNLRKLLASLMALGDQMLEATQKFSRVVKAGAEIEGIRATRLDSVQLLHILSQIPQIIADIVEITIDRVVSEIQQAIESRPDLIVNGKIKTLHKEIPYFGRTKKIEIVSRVNEVVSQIDDKLKNVSVAHDKEKFESVGSAVTEEQVRAMVNSVPNE